MIIDIGGTLRAALSSGCGSEAFRRLLSVVQARVATAILDWDEGAGEQWARYLVDDHVITFVFLKAPLAIVLDDIHDAIASELERNGCYSIRVDSMDSEILSSDRETIVQLAGRPISEQFTNERFSAESLVWATM